MSKGPQDSSGFSKRLLEPLEDSMSAASYNEARLKMASFFRKSNLEGAIEYAKTFGISRMKVLEAFYND